MKTTREQALLDFAAAANDYLDLTLRILAAASVDRSGEAGETRSEAEGLDPEGESAVPAKQGDAQK
jgi:predicted pyridoxine 5'-phosphate oxidase superfamily flavin-nucleotide-binding protein